MSKKITFIGAGSIGFTRKLVIDILSMPAFQDCTFALMDIDEDRLGFIKKAVERIIEAGKFEAKVIATTNRIEALTGADGVLCTILQGGVDVWRHDIEIPAKYGVDLNVGDTRGPAGIFRALRTIPVMLDICRDMEKYCPKAILLNYTNPMAMICRAIQGETKILATGLCHSVQLTSEMLAEWIGAPMDEITYLCAGINHQAWYLNFEWNGKDAYPLIMEAIKREEIYRTDVVRNEMLIHLGKYVTESSGHNSEYNAWFRKRPDLIEKYCNIDLGQMMNPGVHAATLKCYFETAKTWKSDIDNWINEKVDLTPSHEYAAYIFDAIFGDGKMFRFNGNVRNFGLIPNITYGSCVEVPVIASKNGLESIYVGPLPAQLAILNDINARCEELAVEAAIEGDPMKVFHSICYDPLTSAVLSLEEIKNMVNEMFDINKDWLPHFKSTRI